MGTSFWGGHNTRGNDGGDRSCTMQTGDAVGRFKTSARLSMAAKIASGEHDPISRCDVERDHTVSSPALPLTSSHSLYHGDLGSPKLVAYLLHQDGAQSLRVLRCGVG